MAVWKLRRIGDCFDVRVSGVDKAFAKGERSVRLCNYVDVYHNRLIEKSLPFSHGTATDVERERFALKRNDVIITKDSETPSDIAVPALVSDDMPDVICGYHLALLRPDPQVVDGQFFAYALQTPVNRHYFFTLANGVTRFGLTHGSISAAQILLPCVTEQKEIAITISSWDRAIEAIQQLIKVKRRRMKAIMQHMVTDRNLQWPTEKLGDHFINRKTKGKSRLQKYSVTMNRGLVPRASLDRKSDTTLEPEQHLLIEKGDIAYNMMRMWQGASGIAAESGLVSPAYVVIRSRGKVDPLFASYWFKMPRIVKKFQDYSHGLTKDRLRLYYKDFASISLPMPPLQLQQQIAKVMQCCDRELDALERKVELFTRQKKGLMQQLLTGKTRVKLPKGTA